MQGRCQGFSRIIASDLLFQCPYDATFDTEYCTYHSKVAAGLITSIDGKNRPSWAPKKAAAGEPEVDPLELLLREWDL
jgi:hypothetical protein